MDEEGSTSASTGMSSPLKLTRETSSKHPLLNGFQLETDEVHCDSSLTADLGNGRVWRKRVYPRQGYPDKQLRWSTVEEILSFLISFDCHSSWIVHHVPQQPPSGTILFYDRSKTKKYREDGYEWKKRKSLSTIVREDRMRLKVGGYQLLYGCYAHSSSNSNLHRRTYWLIHNPNVIMVHYLEVPSSSHSRTLEKSTLELCDTPSDWSMLTISDPNLCALLEVVKTDTVSLTTEGLFTQLSLILNNNLEQAASLEDALISNNAGLPVDMYLDTRSKKMGNIKIDPSLFGDSLAQSPSKEDNKRLVESLHKAPHLVVCQSENGAMSCFMTFPPPSRTSEASMFPPGAKLPLPTLSQSTKLSLYSPRDSVKSDGKKKGKEKSSGSHEKNGETRVLGVLSQMLSFMKQSAPKISNQQRKKPVQWSDKKHDYDLDYDPEKFSKFAHRLSDFDHSNVPSHSLSDSSSDCEDSIAADMNVNEGATAGSVDKMDAHCSNTDSTNLEQNYVMDSTLTTSNQPHNMEPTSHLPTTQNNSTNGANSISTSRDSDMLNLDLDSESIQQLLQLPPGVTVDDQIMDSSHSGSHLMELINSLTSPEQTSSPGVLEQANVTTAPTMTTESVVSDHNGGVFPVWTSSSEQSVSAFAHSSESLLGVHLNPHTASFHPQAQSMPHPYNMQSSASNCNSQNQQDFLLQPQNHLQSNVYTHQGSARTEFSTQLYSLPQSSSNLEPNTSVPFPGSLVPSEEYQDLESLMNTIITNTDTESHAQVFQGDQFTPAVAMSTPMQHQQQPSDTLGVFDTHSLNLSTSPSPHCNHSPTSHHLSLPDLTLSEDTSPHPSTSNDTDAWTQFYTNHNPPSTQSTSARSSSCLSGGPLQDIPEGLQMELEEISPSFHQLDVYDYRPGGSSVPSSPGQASASSCSSVSGYDVFETGSPSVLELCELLSESPNVQQNDFSHLTLSDSEQQQLFRAAKTIQNAFRQYKDRRQARNKQKRAALKIEKYYKQYREAKEQQDHAARKIQQQYRDYRRSRDLNRAVLFVQQMYRYHRSKRSSNYLPSSTN